MGLFNNYTKPGPGIDKNAPPKKGFDLFFDIFKRRIGALIKLNIMYVLCSLPAILLYFVIASGPVLKFVESLLASAQIDEASQSYYISFLSLFFSMLALTILGSGPASAAMSYIMRCFVRDEHVWHMSDFFKKSKENFKQGMIAFIVDFGVLLTGAYSLTFYCHAYIKNGSVLGLLAMLLLIVFLCLFAFAHFYLYQLMVTFEDKLLRLYKNSFLLALATFPQCLLAAALIILAEYIIFNTFVVAVSIVLIILFLVAFVRFPAEFFTSRIIQTKILENMPEYQAMKGSEENDG